MYNIREIDSNLGILKVTNSKDYSTQEFTLGDKVEGIGENRDNGRAGRIVQISIVNRLRYNGSIISKSKVQFDLDYNDRYCQERRTFSKNFPFIHASMEEVKVD